MTDETSTPPTAKRVRWDDSVPHDAEQPVRAMVSSEAADPVSAEPSCNANDAIRLHGGENLQSTAACSVQQLGPFPKFVRYTGHSARMSSCSV